MMGITTKFLFYKPSDGNDEAKEKKKTCDLCPVIAYLSITLAILIIKDNLSAVNLVFFFITLT